MGKPTIRKLFIANRGEIARRIADGARRLGITTVALTARRPPPRYLSEYIDEFIEIEEESSARFLDGEDLLQRARDRGCDAVHPGFGFLSENAGFAAMVEKAGLIWVGPPATAINAMASKARARILAEACQVPCVPGMQDGADDPARVRTFADQVGYPILIKAALGGGGKGMRVVGSADELDSALTRASSEAISSFGDGSLIVERYLTCPRHVEVQILADQQEHIVAIGDRDCSVQRRHQKIIEEAPAPGLSGKTRNGMAEAAVRLARKAGYVSAGTVEFLVDWSPAAQKSGDPPFYFLEMNTRLQVEHPVTEEVYGLDLVGWQLRIAMGQALPESLHQSPPLPNRHSVEARIYAEDCFQDFLPSPGTVCAFVPHQRPGLRWECGLDSIDEVPADFDPMVAKIVATAEDRPAALELLRQGIHHTVLAGPAHNLPLLGALCGEADFRRGPVHTGWLPERLAGINAGLEEKRERVREQADALLNGVNRAGHATPVDIPGLTRRVFGSPVHAAVPEEWVTLGSTGLHNPSWPGMSATVSGLRAADGTRHAVRIDAATAGGHRTFLLLDGFTFERRRRLTTGPGAGDQGSDEAIRAPVPGKVIKINIKPGSKADENETLFVLESMKIEFEVKSTKVGIIDGIHVSEGQQVAAEEVLGTWQRGP